MVDRTSESRRSTARTWVGLILLALLANLSVAAATHGAASHRPQGLEHAAPSSDVLQQDCSICAALASSVGFHAASGLVSLLVPVSLPTDLLRIAVIDLAPQWWASAASRAPPHALFLQV